MNNILSSIIIAIITAIFSVLGTLYVQKVKSENTNRKNALYLYLNLKQTKYDIDGDKKAIDQAALNIVFLPYFSSFDYIAVLSELKDKLSEHEIMVITNFYENVKKLDNYKMGLGNAYHIYINYPIINPALPHPYESQYQNCFSAFKYNINSLTNSEEYKSDIVEIISKLKNIKDK